MSLNPSTRFEVLRQFALVFLIASLVLMLIALWHLTHVTAREQALYEHNHVIYVAQGEMAIGQQLAGVETDLNYLSSLVESMLSSTDIEQGLSSVDRKKVANLLTLFCREKPRYDQIRFLNTAGDERVRINANDGAPYSVSSDNLQNKSSRYYYKAISQLERGEIYVSPFDLNVEKGEIERPYRPMLRFAKAIYNADQEYAGSLILNLLGQELLDSFELATKSIKDQVGLANNDGYWISHPNPEKEWGFMLNHEYSLPNELPGVWEEISTQTSGQLNLNKHLITFGTVSPDWLARSKPHSVNSALGWKVVSVVDPVDKLTSGLFGKYFSLYALLLGFTAFGSWLLAKSLVKHRHSIMQVTFEQRFRKVLENSDLVSVGLDYHGNVEFCNHALVKLLGWKRENILGQPWVESCVPETQRLNTQAFMNNILSGESPTEMEDAKLLAKDGSELSVEWNHTPIKDDEGHILGLTCIGKDVTDARRKEKQVSILSRAIEQSPLAVLIVDTKGLIEYVNPGFSSITGYTSDEVIGKNPSILKTVSRSEDPDYTELWNTIAAGGTWHGVFKNQRKNGETYWASAIISGLKNAKGNIVNYVGIQTDITERINLEKKFRLSVEGAPYAIAITNADGRITLVNTAIETYFGYERKELMGQTVDMLIPHELLAKYHAVQRDSSEKQSSGPQHLTDTGQRIHVQRKDGSRFPVEISLNVIQTDEGTLTLISIIDITQRTLLEEEVKHSETLATIGRLASMIAHDMRNPLSSIKMGLQIMGKDDTTNDQRRELRSIAMEQIGHMDGLMNDLLNYASPPELKPEWINLDKILNESINTLQGEIERFDTQIVLNITQGLPTIYADSGKLRQVFSNLISNAIHAASEIPSKPRIEISAMARLGDERTQIQVEISDNGPGIDIDKIDLLFAPFYTTRSSGSGLGLAIVKRLIDQHHGSITIQNRAVSKGVICTVTLPLLRQVEEPPPSLQEESR